MAKRPWLPFYPSDWLANTSLKRCNHEEKGVWLEILCLMHDSESYGILRWNSIEISRVINCKPKVVRGLISKKILKGTDDGFVEDFIFTPTLSGRRKGSPILLIPKQQGPLWYSSRMVVDEYKRLVRADPNHAPNTAPKGGLSASLSSHLRVAE